jgi:hypothetical protein
VTTTELRRALPFLFVPLVLFLVGCGIAPWGPLASSAAETPTAAAESPTAAAESPTAAAPSPAAAAASPEPSASLTPFPPGSEDLQRGEEAWRAAGVGSYHWQVRFGCECLLTGPVQVTVVDGRATEVLTPSGPMPLDRVAGFPLTVDDLYAVAHEAIAQGGTAKATWGTVLGIPATLQTDPIPQAIDDELSITVSSFEPTP